MSSAIRASDPNHLIALGLDNGNSAATDRTGSPSSYERLHAHPAVDLVDAHDFFAPDAPLPNGFSEIAGIAADNCVLFSAMDAYLRGYRLWIPADCSAAESQDAHWQALEHMKRVL